MHATRQSDLETVIERKFAAPRTAVFDALTQPEHLMRWMKPSNMSLVTCVVDLRKGGRLRYVFQRGQGKTIEVGGVFETVDVPQSFTYLETYDFSPLKVMVASTLEEAGQETLFRQTLKYSSKQECDDDFDGVAESAAAVYGNLERYLGSTYQVPTAVDPAS